MNHAAILTDPTVLGAHEFGLRQGGQILAGLYFFITGCAEE
jgi:hypothetical protein